MQSDRAVIDAATGRGVTTGRDLVPVRKNPPPVVLGARMDGPVDRGGGDGTRAAAIDMRNISPRKILETGYDLYTIGAIGWEEYEMLAFQPELHPGYDATIGALVGNTADPNQPQDFIDLWEKKLTFERRYSPDNTRRIRQIEHLVSILRQLDNPTNLVA